MIAVANTVDTLRAFLESSVNGDGGWGYYQGKSSRIEPTAWALLALGEGGDRRTAAAAFLRRCQARDGLLREDPNRPPNIAFNAIAGLALNGLPQEANTVRRLIHALVDVKGVRLEPGPLDRNIRQNYRLQAWPWIADTFSWVEPTCWALLAMKKLGRSGTSTLARVRDGEAVLFDRCCEGGGWNYGNSLVFGKALHPYVPTTALGVLALQDRRDHPAAVQGIARLERAWSSEESGQALALACLALSTCGRPAAAAVRQHLNAQFARTSFLGSVVASAMALLALTGDRGSADAFVL